MLKPNSRPTEMLSARFPRGDGRKIGKIAEQLGISRSEFIRQSVRERCVELRLIRPLIASAEIARSGI